jgi:hypothetical protein
MLRVAFMVHPRKKVSGFKKCFSSTSIRAKFFYPFGRDFQSAIVVVPQLQLLPKGNPMDGVHLNPMQAINVLLTFVPRMLAIIRWLVFVCFHLALAVLVLILLWCLQLTPADITGWAKQILQTETAQGAAAVIGFLGLSGLALLAAYVKVWQRIYGTIAATFLMDGL